MIYLCFCTNLVRHKLKFVPITGGMSSGPNSDVEDVYRQEQAKEAQVDEDVPPPGPDHGEEPGARVTGDSGSSGSNDSGNMEEDDGSSIVSRCKKYIDAYKKKLCDSSNPASNTNFKCNVPSNPTYDAILSLRLKSMEAPSLNGGVSTFGNILGNFKPHGEVWGVPPVERQIFGARQNISFNFDPVSMMCNSCKDEHRVLSGGGDYASMNRKLFILSDQAFPADVALEGGDCVAIIRLEYGSLHELVDLFIEVTKGCQIPAGSVMLLASLSHLSDVGIEAYTEDLNNAVCKLGRIFRGGIMILPGLTFPPAIVTNSMILRYIADLMTWSSVANIMEGGGPVLNRCYTDLRDLIVEHGTGNVQAAYSVRYRLPEKLGSQAKKKWDSSGYTGLKTGIDPLDPVQIGSILNMAFKELSVGLGLKLFSVASLHGRPPAGEFNRNVILIGSSHAKRMVSTFKAAGARVELIEAATWRATSDMVSLMTGKITSVAATMEDPLLVLCLLDNSYFQAMAADGSISPHLRGQDGRYHIPGELICGPADSAKRMFLQLTPLFKALADLDKLLVTPLPRYLWQPCCNNVDHATNVRDPEYPETQLSDLNACHRLWRGLAHRDKLKNLKVCNVSHILSGKHLWTTDPVHPGDEGYKLVTRYLIQGVTDMEGKRKAMLDDVPDEHAAKMARHDPQGDSTPPTFRPAWMTTSGQFVTPSLPRPFFRGRGRPFMRRF
jgi:hypothetical protein